MLGSMPPEQFHRGKYSKGQAQRRESSPLSAASREPDDEEDEVFFGPLTAAELTGMRRVRSTLHTPTPVLRIQALCRGFLARQEYRRQRDDLRFLAMKGEFSVERRRRWVNVSRPEEPAPLVKRGFRNWFHRSPPMEVKVTIGCETMETGVARKCLGKLLGTFKGAPPLRRTQSLRRRAPSGRPASGGRMSTGALAVHRPLEAPPPVPPLPTFATNPPPPTSSVLVLVPLSDVQPLQDGEKPPTPRKMALFKSGFGSLLSKSPPSKPPVPTYALTPNIRALDSFPTVRSRAVESMNVFVRREEEVASLPCIPRLASAPVVNRVNSECMSVDNARTYNPDTTPSLPIVAPSDSSPPSQPPIVAPPSPIVTPPSPIAAPPMGDSPPAPLSDTDDDSGIAASVTRLAAQPAPNETSHLSPRLSLRLSVDGTSLFSGPAALGLSAFVTPLAPSPEEEEEEEEEKVESDDDPVSARLRSLRSRRLASTGGDTDGRRFRATQNANRKTAEGKPLAKMGNLQLDRLTKLNTRRNSTYMACRIERFTVIKEGDRPPSPSSAMLARAKERMSMEISDEEDDDVCPLSPLFSSEDEGTVETKRKSTDSVSTALGSEEGNSTLMKKVCRRPVRVQWGSRSVLRDAKMDTPVVEGTPKSILVNKCESFKPAETPTDLCVVRVACIEYPSHVSSEDEEDGEEDEYVPHKSREKGRRKKVV
ncbi:hypothetical protein H4218_003255 [Coemansia sp. IMI 209128]|nr:hypothetical protein H4218_003255 [Coemansia sp. IMI 209128]